MIAERTAELATLHDAHFRAKQEERVRRAGSGSVPLSDEEIIERARSATNGTKFMHLWAGDTSEYGGDDSAADLALLGSLTFWTQNRDQLDRLFRRSGLYREKWERADYRERTIDRALNREEINTSGTTPEFAPWTAPEPLPMFEQPAFPVDFLPEPERTWVKALAIATQTPVALPAMMSDGAVAIVVAKRVEVEVRDGWREPLNAYNLTALDSGTRKTAVARAVESPLKADEKQRSATMAPTIAKARAKRDVVEKRLENLKKRQAAEAVNDIAIDGNIDALINELLSDALAVPVAPRYLVDDITPEKLADLLGQHGERMGVLSAEGGIFQVVAGRYTDGKADGLDLFLKAYSGDSLPIDRIGREAKQLDAPALSLVISPQPEVLRGLARYPGFRGRGFLARFDYAVPVSTVGHRTIAATPVPDTVRTQYEDLITALLALPDPTATPDPGPGDSGNSVNATGRIVLTLSEEAAKRFIAFETWLEPRLDRDDGALGDIQDWASKVAGKVARWAGRLHVVQHIQANGDGRPSTLSSFVIDAQTIEAAIAIAKTFLIPHAKTAFAMMSRDQTESRAHRVLHVVRSWEQPTITRRDVWRRLCRSFTAVDDLDAPLALLVEHGYLRPVPSVATGPGRKPSPTFAINPLCRGETTVDCGIPAPGDVNTSDEAQRTCEPPESVDRIDTIRDAGRSVNSVNGNREPASSPSASRTARSVAPDGTQPATAEHGGEEGDL
jgi:replicative DNA helicase